MFVGFKVFTFAFSSFLYFIFNVLLRILLIVLTEVSNSFLNLSLKAFLICSAVKYLFEWLLMYSFINSICSSLNFVRFLLDWSFTLLCIFLSFLKSLRTFVTSLILKLNLLANDWILHRCTKWCNIISAFIIHLKYCLHISIESLNFLANFLLIYGDFQIELHSQQDSIT